MGKCYNCGAEFEDGFSVAGSDDTYCEKCYLEWREIVRKAQEKRNTIYPNMYPNDKYPDKIFRLATKGFNNLLDRGLNTVELEVFGEIFIDLLTLYIGQSKKGNHQKVQRG